METPKTEITTKTICGICNHLILQLHAASPEKLEPFQKSQQMVLEIELEDIGVIFQVLFNANRPIFIPGQDHRPNTIAKGKLLDFFRSITQKESDDLIYIQGDNQFIEELRATFKKLKPETVEQFVRSLKGEYDVKIWSTVSFLKSALSSIRQGILSSAKNPLKEFYAVNTDLENYVKRAHQLRIKTDRLNASIRNLER